MASGSFQVGTSNGYIVGTLNWSSSSDINSNSSNVYYELRFSRTNSGYTTTGSGDFYVTINGTQHHASKSFTITQNSNTFIMSGTINVPHNSDGTKQVVMRVDGNTNVFDVYLSSSSPWLDTIPRASTVSSNVSWTAGVDNLPITINRKSTDFHHSIEIFVQHTYDSNWTRIGQRDNINGSTTWQFTTAENTAIYNTISAYENRPVIVRVWTYNSAGTQIGGYQDKVGTVYAVSTSTMSYSPSSTFNLGDNITGTIAKYNSNFTYDAVVTFGSFTKSWSDVGKNPILSFTSAEKQTMFAQVPNANSKTGTVEIRTFYNGVRTEDGIPTSNKTTFTLVVSNSSPSFGSGFTYKDTNATTAGITEDDQYIIQNKSTLQVTIPVAAKATAVDGASMIRYEATINGKTVTANWSNSADVIINLGTVSIGTNTTLTVKAVDSRGSATVASKTVNIVAYAPPIVTTSSTRLNNFESETTIALNGSVSSLTVNGVNKNAVLSAKYQYREAGGTYTALTSFTYNGFPNYSATSVELTLDNTKAWDTLVVVTDKLGSTTVTKTVSAGKPMIFIDIEKESVGINRFPTESRTFEMETHIVAYAGKNLRLKGSTTGSASNTGDILFEDSEGTELGRIWRDAASKLYTRFGSEDKSREIVTIDASGSNSNGRYIRYSDGTQICWHSQSFSSTSGMWSPSVSYPFGYYQYLITSWTFPATFVSAPAVSVSGDITGAMMESHNAYSASTTGCSVESGTLNPGGTDTSGPALSRTLIAIGRWK